MAYSSGGHTIMLAGLISLRYYIRASKIGFFRYDIIDINLRYFSYINVSLIAKLCIQNLTQGLQKIFGGPHFGHPCCSFQEWPKNCFCLFWLEKASFPHLLGRMICSKFNNFWQKIFLRPLKYTCVWTSCTQTYHLNPFQMMSFINRSS